MAANTNETILVTGARGHQGGAVLHHLHGKFPLRVRAHDSRLHLSNSIGLWSTPLTTRAKRLVRLVQK